MKYYYTILALSWALTAYVVYHEHQTVTDLQQQAVANERICEEENRDASYIIAHQEMLLSIIKDGASYKEAEIILDTAMKEGVYPKP